MSPALINIAGCCFLGFQYRGNIGLGYMCIQYRGN